MRDEQIGRFVRQLRHRRGWRQVDLSERAGRPRSALVDLEAGRIGRLTVDTIRDFVEALGGRITIEATSGASDPRLLIDAGHAFLQEHWKRRLERWGWSVRAEVSFNHYGDRGRIDLLAFHFASGILLVIEIKTVLWDVQALLGSLDVRSRVAPLVVHQLGWQPRVIVPTIVFGAATTVRRRLQDHAALFAPFELRGREAASWLRKPMKPMKPPSGAIILTRVPDVAVGDGRRAGRRRVRRSAAQSRSTDASAGAAAIVGSS